MSQDPSPHVAASHLLDRLVDRTFALYLELAEGERPSMPFVLILLEGDEESLIHLPRDADRMASELEATIADFADDAIAYAFISMADVTLVGETHQAVVVEAEERGDGYALRFARPFAVGEGTIVYSAPDTAYLGRGENRLVGTREVIDTSPQVLLMEALIAVIEADQIVEADEAALLATFAANLPAFVGYELESLLAVARRQLDDGGGFPDAIRHLTHIHGELARRRCYVLAAEMAYVAGTIVEDDVVAAIGDTLTLERAFRTATHNVISARLGREELLAPDLVARVLMAVIFADGAFDREEMAVVREFCRILPEFEGTDPMSYFAAAQHAVREAGTPMAAIELVADESSTKTAASETLVALACEMAYASDGLDPREDRLVTRLVERLGVSASFLIQSKAVFEAKYAV